MNILLFALALWTAGPPRPYVAKPACPFECCQYGRWIARVRLPVRPHRRDLRSVAFTIAARDTFEALEGEVWVNRPGLLLDHLGEGGWNAWARGRQVGTNEEDWTSSSEDSLVRFVRWPDFEWWVHIRTKDGRTGWILVDDSRTPEFWNLPVDGSDGCA